MRATVGLLPGLYQHKDGGFYFVDTVDEHCSTNGENDGKRTVRYFSLAHGHWANRTREEFCAPVTWADGKIRPRFMPVFVSTVRAELAAFVDWQGYGYEVPMFAVEPPVLGKAVAPALTPPRTVDEAAMVNVRTSAPRMEHVRRSTNKRRGSER